jgi:LysM repeat protein
MISPRLLLASALAIALASCAPQKDNFDTGNPYGAADGGQPQASSNNPNQPVLPANPTYDTPPAYEDSGTAAVAPATPDVLAPSNPTHQTALPAGGAAPGVASVHTVVKGDTLGGIANKYKVPIASIKKANAMTKDTVVLGKKLQIPAH